MATPDSAKPTYIYKLIPSDAAPPDPLPSALPVSELDRSSGFIHLSTAKQVPNTLKRFFTNESRVYILRIPYDPIESNIKWEDPRGEAAGPRGGEGMFPHLYNDFKVGNEEVESVGVWDRKDGQSWDEALESANEWLLY
ncbi:uncharacterized protein FIBRA_03183 [Fibroporia radiculosa]|uniref:DUF952 domain-containing protein n=1 Tax=Fibroporia radiculosa TaxID=599839 RepID=J4GNC2_9APHY|nr:uncharacterized protein FIBRA_03183 [Fibroporia radiculosa]CCM01135.1 predicted protein [Fibroporia radiculosa]